MVGKKVSEIVDDPDFAQVVKTSLSKQMKALHRSDTNTSDGKVSGNGKFALDPSLFTLKYGGLDDFKKGVRELVGAPHPKVWEEMAKEHMERDDSQKPFNPGNYDMETWPEEEYMVCVDPKKGSEASKKSKHNRRVKPLEELRKKPLAVKAKLWKEELLGISLYTGPMFYKYNAVGACPGGKQRAPAALRRACCRCGFCVQHACRALPTPLR
jgi:hypothetical protein